MSTTYPIARQVRRIPVGSLETITMTARQADGTAKDLSAGSTVYFHASHDGSAVTTNGVASFVTDGSDGKLQFTLTSTEANTVRELLCEFEVVELNWISEPFTLQVNRRAKVV